MIPLIRPLMPSGEAIERHLARSRAAGMFSNFGPCHQAASRLVSEEVGGIAVLTTTGTAAIEVALLSLGLPAGARVAVPDFTHTGTLLAVVRAGFEPVLVSVDPATWVPRQLDIREAWAHGWIDAAVIVNPFGYGVDLGPWEDLARGTFLPVVYDFAGAWGAKLPEDLTSPVCFSFHATKNLGIGEGGAVVFPATWDPAIAAEAQRLINFDTLPDRSIASTCGYNQKMDELRCAALLAALEPEHRRRIEARTAAKLSTARIYLDMLGVTSAPLARDAKPSLCVVPELPAADLEAASPDLGAVFKAYYPLLSRMPALADVERLSESCDAMTRLCALPSDVDFHEACRVVDLVRRFTGAPRP